ncbi:MAG: sporulation protein YunB [Clostridia bacterium]|nr:sporulation protein YunB [Clostridia bacterium]
MRRKKSSLRIKLPVFLIFFIGVCFLLSVAENSVRPILRTMALANVEIIAGEKISEAIEEEMVSEDYELESIISFEKDADGRINAVKTNIVTANRLKSALSLAVLDKIGQITESDVAVPSGSLTGLALLSGRGPNIPVKTVPVGSVRTNLQSKLTNGGINQTLHRIILEITVDMNVILPRETVSSEVSMNVVVSETVIVGTVPEYFSDISIPLGES